MLKVVLIRHGETLGNQQKRYVGCTDESLCAQGIEKLQELKKRNKYPNINLLFVSPLKRCQETAKILYENSIYQKVEDLRECDFGMFENKNYYELRESREYQKWIDSEGKMPFPGGEDIHEFQQRCVNAFLQVMKQEEEKKQELCIGFVVHGGTIMALMDNLCAKDKNYFEWQVQNGEGFVCNYVGGRLELCYSIIC